MLCRVGFSDLGSLIWSFAEGGGLARLAFHNRIKGAGLLQCTWHWRHLLLDLPQFPAIAVLVLQRAFEVFLQADDHRPLFLDQAPKLGIVVCRALLLFPQRHEGSFWRARGSYEAGHVRRAPIGTILPWAGGGACRREL